MLGWLVVVGGEGGEADKGDLFCFCLPIKRSRLEVAMANRWWRGLDNISVHLGVVSRLHPRSFMPRPAEIPPPCPPAKGHGLRVTYLQHHARGLMLSSIVFYYLLIAK